MGERFPVTRRCGSSPRCAALAVIAHQHAQGQVQRNAGCREHQRRSPLGVAIDQHLRRRHCQPCVACSLSMVYPREDRHALVQLAGHGRLLPVMPRPSLTDPLPPFDPTQPRRQLSRYNCRSLGQFGARVLGLSGVVLPARAIRFERLFWRRAPLPLIGPTEWTFGRQFGRTADVYSYFAVDFVLCCAMDTVKRRWLRGASQNGDERPF